MPESEYLIYRYTLCRVKAFSIIYRQSVLKTQGLDDGDLGSDDPHRIEHPIPLPAA